MSQEKPGNQGAKTREHHISELERKDGMAKPGEGSEVDNQATAPTHTPRDQDARQSELPVSRGGMHQESRDHNKHNNAGQSGHKPQTHSPAEEKR